MNERTNEPVVNFPKLFPEPAVRDPGGDALLTCDVATPFSQPALCTLTPQCPSEPSRSSRLTSILHTLFSVEIFHSIPSSALQKASRCNSSHTASCLPGALNIQGLVGCRIQPGSGKGHSLAFRRETLGEGGSVRPAAAPGGRKGTGHRLKHTTDQKSEVQHTSGVKGI